MKPELFFSEGARRLQDHFGTRALADRIVERLGLDAFDEASVSLISSAPCFFLATTDARGYPDCSYKGGEPGFVRVLGERMLAFPHYDGNGMFRSLGNIAENPRVGLLFIDFVSPRRLRVNGLAKIDVAVSAREPFPGADAVVIVEAESIFPNCPRYVHRSSGMQISEYAPRRDHVPPEPEWKSRPEFAEVLPPACQDT
jgi:hypothetical protein